MADLGRAAFIGGPAHGNMLLFADLPERLYMTLTANKVAVSLDPQEGARWTTYLRQDSLRFTPVVADGVHTLLYFTEGLNGRSVPALQLDMLWPDGWAYTDA